jgi:hypothetical protein
LKFDGRIDKYKTRLVAKGYSQVHHVDYHDIYFLIVKITSIQVLIVLVATNDFGVHQMDVKTTFLMDTCKKQFIWNNLKDLFNQGLITKNLGYIRYFMDLNNHQKCGMKELIFFF